MTKLKNELEEVKRAYILSQQKSNQYRYEKERLENTALQLSKQFIEIFFDM